MNTLPTVFGLLAQLDRTSRLHALQQGFEDTPFQSDLHVLMLVALAACAVLLLIARALRRRARGNTQPTDYLARAARTLELSPSELRDLRTVATRAGLQEPTSVVLSPANLAHAIASMNDEDPHLLDRLTRLSTKLFGAEGHHTEEAAVASAD